MSTEDWSDIFEYRDGVLYWATDRPASHFKNEQYYKSWKSQFSGKRAGAIGSHGYWQVVLKKRFLLNHRIIYEIHHGPIPGDMEVDHIDMNRTNNRIENLRLATTAQNRQNSRKQRNNKSGFKGVSWCTREKKWRAQIMTNGKFKSLGYYDTAQEAHVVYCNAAITHHGVFARLM